MPENKVVIAIQNLQTEIASLTMVGDWFLAESVSYRHGDGFTHTFLHAMHLKSPSASMNLKMNWQICLKN